MRIAVTTDFSERSRSTFAVSAALSKKFGASVLVVHHAQPTLFPSALKLTDFYTSIEHRMSELLETEPALRGTEASTLVIRGGSIHNFVQTLEEEKVDLLVLASHGRTAVTRFLLGSFTERAIRFVSCSALVCRPGSSDTSFEVKRVLVAHDFSPNSRAALALAHDWARAFGADVRLLHVIDSECGITGFEAEFFEGWKEFHERKRSVALDELRSLAEQEWTDVTTDVQATIGHPTLEILSHADQMDADLIVLGKRGISALEVEGVSLGHVAEKVVRQSSRPVLLAQEP